MSNESKLSSSTAAIVCLFALGVDLFAQTNAGQITGSIADQQSGALPGVKIVAVNLDTNVQQSATSSNAGVYSLPALEPGRYRMTAELAGFNKLIKEPILVETSKVTSIDLQLSVGDTKVEVTVTGEAPLVQQANATVQYGINQKALDELPVSNQSALQVLSLVPGVLGDAGGEQAAVTTGFVTPGGGISVSGGRMGSTNYLADGVSNNSLFFGRISLSFSTDAISEVDVKVNNYSAEYGRVGGGIVTMTTKSGNNQLHGTLFSFSQNDILNAAPYSNTFNKKGLVRYWRGGADIGGPVYIPKLYNGRNRTFFFFNYEPLKRYQQSSAFARVPTTLERQGDFSQSVYDTTNNQKVFIFQQYLTNASGTGWTNTKIVPAANTPFPQFVNNVIPKPLVSPIGQKVLSLLPLPNMALNGLGQNYSVFRNVRNIDDRWNIKIDQVISSNNRLQFRFTEVPTKGSRFFIGGLTEVVPTDTATGTNIGLNDTHTWGGNKVNELRLGFNRTSNVRRQTDEQLSNNWYKELGFPSYLSKGFPAISAGSGYANVQGISSSPGSYSVDNTYQLTDILSWTKGKHNIKTGFEFLAPQMNLTDYNSVGGSWTFANTTTNIGSGSTATVLGIPNAATGVGWASLLLGFPSGVSLAPAVIPYQYRWKYYAGFLQDDFKVSKRLTLNIGARYQIEVPRSEKHHNQGYFVQDEAVTLATGRQQIGYLQLHGLGNAINTLWPTRYNNIEPRLGFAYRLPKLIPGLTVMRGGYAITHTPTSGLFRAAIPDLAPPASQFANNGAANGLPVQLDSFPAVLGNAPLAFPADGKVTNLTSVTQVYYLPKNVSIPYIQQWNLGFGFQFGKDYGLDLTYVGSKGTQLFGPSQLFNTINIQEYATQFKAGLNMGDLFPNPAGLKDQNGNTILVSRQNLLRAIPTLNGISNPLTQGYGSFYNALQSNLTKRFSKGVQFNANYTWMKSTDTTSCEGQFCSDNIQNWGTGAAQLLNGDRHLEHSISVFSIPHTFRYSFNWDLPVGKGKWLLGSAHGWANQIVGNWKITGTGSAQSGSPIQTATGNTAGFPEDVGRIRANIILGVPYYVDNWKNGCNNALTQRCPYINSLNLFSPPAFLTVGNTPRVPDYLRMPSRTTFNMAILKEFPIHEQIRVAFRAELYGALNHVFFGTNGNNFSIYQNLDYSKANTPTVTQANIAPAYADVGANIGGNRTIQLGLKLYF